MAHFSARRGCKPCRGPNTLRRANQVETVLIRGEPNPCRIDDRVPPDFAGVPDEPGPTGKYAGGSSLRSATPLRLYARATPPRGWPGGGPRRGGPEAEQAEAGAAQRPRKRSRRVATGRTPRRRGRRVTPREAGYGQEPIRGARRPGGGRRGVAAPLRRRRRAARAARPAAGFPAAGSADADVLRRARAMPTGGLNVGAGWPSAHSPSWRCPRLFGAGRPYYLFTGGMTVLQGMKCSATPAYLPRRTQRPAFLYNYDRSALSASSPDFFTWYRPLVVSACASCRGRLPQYESGRRGGDKKR